MRLAEVVHALGTERHAHVSGVVAIVGSIAIGSHGFAVRADVVVVVPPCPVFADQHT